MKELGEQETLYDIVKETIEQRKNQEETKRTDTDVSLSEKERNKNEIVNLIMKFYKGTLTQEEKEKFLLIQEKKIPGNILKELYELAKAHIKGKTIDEKVSEKLERLGKEVKITLERDPEQIQQEVSEMQQEPKSTLEQDPEQIEQEEGESYDER